MSQSHGCRVKLDAAFETLFKLSIQGADQVLDAVLG